MSKFGSDLYNIVVGLLCFVAFILLFVMLKGGLALPDTSIKLPLLVITGVMALFATLALVAVTFSGGKSGRQRFCEAGVRRCRHPYDLSH